VQSRRRNLALVVIALGIALGAGLMWSLGVASIATLAWSRPTAPDPPVEPLVRDDDCRFLANGDYVCAGPVGTPRCGIAVVDVEYQTAIAVVSGELVWDDKPELLAALAIEHTEVVVGLGRTTLELAFSFEREPAPVTIDLSDVDVTISGKPFCEFVVDIVASSPRLAPHFHLPLQSGSDEMLVKMQRPYTVSYYVRLVERIRTMLPHAAVGSDIIVGFPGETARHFAETLKMLERIPLTYLHVFPYSDRPGTRASFMRPKVEAKQIRERARQIREIGEGMTQRFRRSQCGRVTRGLTVDDGRAVVTVNYLKLRLGIPHQRNHWIDVRVMEGLWAEPSAFA
jgi:hypothetical protein